MSPIPETIWHTLASQHKHHALYLQGLPVPLHPPHPHHRLLHHQGPPLLHPHLQGQNHQSTTDKETSF